METAKLKKFVQFARRSLTEQVSAKLDLVLAEGSAAGVNNRRHLFNTADGRVSKSVSKFCVC